MILASNIGLAQDVNYRFRSGVHLSEDHPLSAKQRNVVLNELRYLTGFTDLQIKNTDFILSDHSSISGGSAIARGLLTAALDGPDSFTVECRDRSPAIAFAQIESTLVYRDASDRAHQDWHIRIDFADFRELRGDRAAIVSFGPGMNLLHELTHAILAYPDPLSSADPLGQCERHLNLVRADLGLLLRQHYFPRSRYAASGDSIARISQGEISFRRQHNSSEVFLSFNLDRVIDAVAARSRTLTYLEFAQLFTSSPYRER
jgi:hypothetical protein